MTVEPSAAAPARDDPARAETTFPVVALVLAGIAAASFGAGAAIGPTADDVEPLFLLCWFLGWGVLFWSALAGIAALVSLARRAVARRPIGRAEVVLLAAWIALVVAVLLLVAPGGVGGAAAA